MIFIVGSEEGIFPHSRSLIDNFELEEERRLCYVGITRAMKKLYLTYASSRIYFGSPTANAPSRFLDDIPDKLTKVILTTPKRRSKEYEPDPLNPWEI